MDLTFYVSSRPRKTKFVRENTSHRQFKNFKSKCWESLQHQEILYRIILPDLVQSNTGFHLTTTMAVPQWLLPVRICFKINHTIRKVKFPSKNSILTKPQHFHEFFIQFFFDNFSREIKVVNS